LCDHGVFAELDRVTAAMKNINVGKGATGPMGDNGAMYFPHNLENQQQPQAQPQAPAQPQVNNQQILEKLTVSSFSLKKQGVAVVCLRDLIFFFLMFTAILDGV
jgi:hypothetical protein